jgi:hypothetical protein
MMTPDKIAHFEQMGFPDYFRVEIIVAKVLGLAAVLVPRVPLRIKDWAYAGYGIVLISASLAHLHVGDPIANVLEPLGFLVILAISNTYLHRRNQA